MRSESKSIPAIAAGMALLADGCGGGGSSNAAGHTPLPSNPARPL